MDILFLFAQHGNQHQDDDDQLNAGGNHANLLVNLIGVLRVGLVQQQNGLLLTEDNSIGVHACADRHQVGGRSHCLGHTQ